MISQAQKIGHLLSICLELGAADTITTELKSHIRESDVVMPEKENDKRIRSDLDALEIACNELLKRVSFFKEKMGEE